MIKAVLPLTLLFSSIPVASGIHFKGTLFSDLGLNHFIHSDKEDEAEFRGMSSLRFAFLNANRKVAKIEGNMDINVPYGAYTDSLAGVDSGPLVEGIRFLEAYNAAPVLLDLRKLYLSLYLPLADITLGRQIIHFGKGTLFSPMDVFSSVELLDLAFRRRGSDIAMAAIPLGDLSGLDVVVELPYAGNTHSTALKAFTTVMDWDLSLVGLYRNTDSKAGGEDEVMTGIAFKGDMVVGVQGEIVTHFLNSGSNPLFQAMGGVDYSINDFLFFIAEYLYKDPDLPGFWGKHNAFGSIQYKINDLMNLSGSIIHNFSAELTMGILQYAYNILQNAYITAYVRGYHGSPRQDGEYALRVEVKY